MEQTSDYYDIKNVQLKFFYQLFENIFNRQTMSSKMINTVLHTIVVIKISTSAMTKISVVKNFACEIFL